MSIPKLTIPKKKYTESSTVISMRIPKDMLREIDALSQEKGRTRNEVLTIALEFALEHLNEEEAK